MAGIWIFPVLMETRGKNGFLYTHVYVDVSHIGESLQEPHGGASTTSDDRSRTGEGDAWHDEPRAEGV